jgi:hypothetical protein
MVLNPDIAAIDPGFVTSLERSARETCGTSIIAPNAKLCRRYTLLLAGVVCSAVNEKIVIIICTHSLRITEINGCPPIFIWYGHCVSRATDNNVRSLPANRNFKVNYRRAHGFVSTK